MVHEQMFAILHMAKTQELNGNFCYPVDGHSCVRVSTSIFEEVNLRVLLPPCARLERIEHEKSLVLSLHSLPAPTTVEWYETNSM
jgi:hypothetical protein